MRRAHKLNGGFSLLELMIAAFIGLIVIGGAVSLFTQAMKGSWVTSEKSEMQQDVRAASILLQRDISMAGAGALGQQGLSNNGVGLPTPTSTKSIYPCGPLTCNYISGAPVTYPLSPSGVPTFYSIIPGGGLGIKIGTAAPTDILTIVSADPTLALNCYTASIDSTGTIVTFQLPSPLPGTCVLPSNVTVPQALNDPIVGLQAGDMVLFGTAAVAVVTSAVTTCTPTGTNTACYTVDFAATDISHINQPSITTGSLHQFEGASLTISAVRVLTITYYLDISPSDGVTPRLMRVQNGKLPAPVAENVVNLQFTYNVNNGGTITANLSTLPAGISPAMITQVNIAHLTIRSQLPGTVGYQGFDLQTSISARNLSAEQEYPISGSAY